MQRRRPTWSGNSLVESRTGASAAQNKVPSLYYSLYYSPAPFPLEPIFTPKGAEREKGSGGGKKKICGAASEEGEQLFESSAPGFRCSVGQTPAQLECLPLPRPSFRGWVLKRASHHRFRVSRVDSRFKKSWKKGRKQKQKEKQKKNLFFWKSDSQRMEMYTMYFERKRIKERFYEGTCSPKCLFININVEFTPASDLNVENRHSSATSQCCQSTNRASCCTKLCHRSSEASAITQ